jgi:hypothetical protein
VLLSRLPSKIGLYPIASFLGGFPEVLCILEAAIFEPAARRCQRVVSAALLRLAASSR